MIRAAVLVCFALLGPAAAAWGQGAAGGGANGSAAVGQDTLPAPKGLREQMLDKLRALEAASRPAPKAAQGASAKPADDTTRAVRAEPPAPTDAPTRAPGAPAPTDTALSRSGAPARAAPSGVIVHADSVIAQLRALQGYVVTEYRAEKARYDADSGKLELVGGPELNRGGESMKADSLLTYQQSTAIICGYGKPVLQGMGNEPVQSDQVCYNIDRQTGVALGARTKFQQQGEWFIHGNELYTAGTNRLYGAATEFTSCDLEEPHYHFAASEIKVVHNQVMVARNVTLRFGDVPVLWLPFLVQSLKPDRRSGLLAPTLGLQQAFRTNSGYRRRIEDIGFYWAVNEHLGLTTKIDWESGSYTALTGRLQYRWLRQFLDGDVSFTRYWQSEGRRQFGLNAGGQWQPGERTSLRFSGNYITSTAFVQRYSYDPRELDRTIDSNVGLTHRFSWGNLSLSASRRQQLSNDQVDLTLPTVSLGINPVTLFPATGQARWYNNATWQANASFNARRRDVNELLSTERGRDERTLDGRASSTFTIGKLSWNGALNFDDHIDYPRTLPVADSIARVDSTLYRRQRGQSITWTTGLGFTQQLIGNTHFSPSVSLRGGARLPDPLRPESAEITQRVDLPTRVDFAASLGSNLFGFWPGVGPYSRIRHRIEPRISYTYSPAPTVTELQRKAFGNQFEGLRETNQVTLSFNQTFEAKPVVRDSAGSEAADTAASGAFGQAPPRRLSQVQPVTLLALSSSALIYDFTRARDGEYGLTTTDMSHSIHSDLLPGLTLSVGHDLFRTRPDTLDIPGPYRATREMRTFSPNLRTVNASFSLSSDSRLFQMLGLGRADEEGAKQPADSLQTREEEQRSGGLLPGNVRRTRNGNQSVGSWRATFDYSLMRPRAGEMGETDQMLGGSLSFQPTENWNVSWQTRYSFTRNEFADHVLSLTRDLHRWQATFDFYKAQNGNFTFRFNVRLLDNPDIKLPYEQRSRGLGHKR